MHVAVLVAVAVIVLVDVLVLVHVLVAVIDYHSHLKKPVTNFTNDHEL